MTNTFRCLGYMLQNYYVFLIPWKRRSMNLADELQKLQELHRSGALTDEEFAAAKAAVLAKGNTEAAAPTEPVLKEHLDEVKRQNQLAQLDREWQNEREQYMIQGRNGMRMVPTRAMSVIGGVVVAVFG